MFPKYDDIFEYKEWYTYWCEITILAYNVGDSKMVNRIFKITDEKFIARIGVEDAVKINDFYNTIIEENSNPQSVVLANLHLDKLGLNSYNSEVIIRKIYEETAPCGYKTYLSMHI